MKVFNYFSFNQQEFQQVHEMAMGSPLSAVMASLFMETLEVGPIREIIGNHVTWLRYVDDTLVVLPRRANIQHILDGLNSIHPRIKFTMEEESDGTIPFLDTLIHRKEEHATFGVYRKPTNMDDFIHFLSGHDSRTKSGVVIGFYLRALRICHTEFLDRELSHIKEAFRRLLYPAGFIEKCWVKPY